MSAAELLRAALPYVRKVAEEPESMYGAFHGGDPRDFTHDPECSTVEERAAHAAACDTANRDEKARELADTHSWHAIEGGWVHLTRGGFGLGVTVFRDREAEELLRQIEAALAEVSS